MLFCWYLSFAIPVTYLHVSVLPLVFLRFLFSISLFSLSFSFWSLSLFFSFDYLYFSLSSPLSQSLFLLPSILLSWSARLRSCLVSCVGWQNWVLFFLFFLEVSVFLLSGRIFLSHLHSYRAFILLERFYSLFCPCGYVNLFHHCLWSESVEC